MILSGASFVNVIYVFTRLNTTPQKHIVELVDPSSLRGAMALERVTALGTFLWQCRAEENFEELREQQCQVFKTNFQTMARLNFTDGSALVQRIQEQPWTDDQRKALIGLIQEKVVATAGVSSPGRVTFQNWTNLALYLREANICLIIFCFPKKIIQMPKTFFSLCS